MKRAFTLIEILIVIAVIAILIGIALPSFKGMQDEGRTAKAAGELRSLAAALESYYVHNSKAYPSQGTTVQTNWMSLLTTASPKILDSNLVDPFDTGNHYRYATSASSNSVYYVVFSVGADNMADITGVSTAGAIQGDPDDDIYICNGISGTGGF